MTFEWVFVNRLEFGVPVFCNHEWERQKELTKKNKKQKKNKNKKKTHTHTHTLLDTMNLYRLQNGKIYKITCDIFKLVLSVKG